MARGLSHAYSVGQALLFTTLIHLYHHEVHTTRELAEEGFLINHHIFRQFPTRRRFSIGRLPECRRQTRISSIESQFRR